MTKIIAIEGADMRGKSTQLLYLKNSLDGFGYKTVSLKAPFKDSVTGKLIYKMLENGSCKKWPTLFQVLQFINKKSFLFRNKKLFRNMDFVLLDRWHLSAQVYGFALGANMKFLNFLENCFPLPKADLTVVIHGKPYSRATSDSVDSEIDLQDRIQALYLAKAAVQPDMFVNVSNEGSIEVIQSRILTML